MLDAASIFEILFAKYCLNLVVESFNIFKTHSESLHMWTLSNEPTEASIKSLSSIAFAAAKQYDNHWVNAHCKGIKESGCYVWAIISTTFFGGQKRSFLLDFLGFLGHLQFTRWICVKMASVTLEEYKIQTPCRMLIAGSSGRFFYETFLYLMFWIDWNFKMIEILNQFA